MADKKKDPEPKLYHPLHDQNIEKILESYQKLNTEEAGVEFQKERGHDRDALYNTVVAHLAQHGVDEKTGKFKRYSYNDHKDKRKWSEDLVHRLALHGIAKHYGKDAVGVYAGNHDLLRQYIEQNMVTDELRDYESIVEYLSESKNLKDGFHEDPRIKGMIDAYLQNISSGTRQANELQRHLARPEHHPKILGFANKAVSKHGLQFKPHTALPVLLRTIAESASPDFKPKKGKWLEEVLQKKK